MSAELFGFKYKWLEPTVAATYPYNEAPPLIHAAQKIAKASLEYLPSGFTYDDVIRTNKETYIRLNDAESNTKNENNHEHSFEVALICEAIQRMEKSIRLDFLGNSATSLAWQEIAHSNLIIGQVIGFHTDELTEKYSKEYFRRQGKDGGSKAKGNRSPFREKACESLIAIINKKFLWNDGHSTSSLTEMFWPELKEVVDNQSGSWFDIEYDDIVFARIKKNTIRTCIDRSRPY